MPAEVLFGRVISKQNASCILVGFLGCGCQYRATWVHHQNIIFFHTPDQFCPIVVGLILFFIEKVPAALCAELLYLLTSRDGLNGQVGKRHRP